jgi:hypothetical protein
VVRLRRLLSPDADLRAHHLMAHSTIRRGKHRVNDRELHTTRLVGAGWTWDCTCGEKGTWHGEREDATIAARTHQFFAHGVRDSSPTGGTEAS